MVANRPDLANTFLKAQTSLASRHVYAAVAWTATGGALVVAQAWLVAALVDKAVFGGTLLSSMTPDLALLLAVISFRAITVWAADTAAALAGPAVVRHLRERLVAHILRLGPTRNAEESAGGFVSVVTDSLPAIAPYFSNYLPAAMTARIVPPAILSVVLLRDWPTALVLFVTAPLVPAFMLLIGHGADELNRRQWRKLARMSGHFLDVIQGLTTLKIFNASQAEGLRVARIANAYRQDTMAVLKLAFLSSLALEFFATVAIAMIAVLVGFRLMWGTMTFVNGFFVLLLAPEFYLPLRALGAAYHARLEAVGATERVLAILDLPAPEPWIGSRSMSTADKMVIQFDDVHLVYPDGRRALSGISFSVAAGEKLALVGPSGAGKSTVLRLLLGFERPTSGRILVNGLPLDAYDIEEWRRQIAHLPQHPHMFEATVAQNIAMQLGQPVSDIEKVRSAALQAAAGDVIAGLPLGLDTIVGERGAGLSGGEAQRIALARAFYREPRLVLIDEAAAHLDRNSAAVIARALSTLATSCTAISITHRLQTARDADRIIVLTEGKVAEDGTHSKLLAAGGLYSRLWSQRQNQATEALAS